MKLSMKLIGILELMAAGIFTYLGLNVLFQAVKVDASIWNYVSVGLAFGAAALNLAGGALLLISRSKAGYIFSMLNTALQIPTINLPGLVYQYVGWGQVSAGIEGSKIAFNANISPGRLWFALVPAGEYSFSLNFVAIAFSLFLWRSWQKSEWLHAPS
jgi:hypothetical protein